LSGDHFLLLLGDLVPARYSERQAGVPVVRKSFCQDIGPPLYWNFFTTENTYSNDEGQNEMFPNHESKKAAI
jgi:hypothetical protein